MNKYEKIFGSGWFNKLKHFLESEEFKKIGKTLKSYQEEGKTIYPSFDNVFRAFKECPYEDLCVVVLTTNTYMKGEGDGIAFSSKQSVAIEDTPPVLTKIFDEVEHDVARGLYLKRNNDLGRWANQGILLLNCDLTMEKGKPGSHIKLWEPLIEQVINLLTYYNTGIIYVLIGKEAEKYKEFINKEVNDIYILEHPMLSIKEKRAWRSQNIFSTINRVTKFLNNKEIQWID